MLSKAKVNDYVLGTYTCAPFKTFCILLELLLFILNI